MIIVMVADTPRIEQIAWLEGSWTGSAFGGTIDEVFGSPAGGSLLGTSRVVADDKLIHREFIVLAERDGTMVYEVHLPNREPHVFKLAQLEATCVVWEDASNTWPKRISYTRRVDEMDVLVEGDPGQKVERFTMRKR